MNYFSMEQQIDTVVFDFDGMVYLTNGLFSERFSRDFGVPLDEVSDLFKNEFKDCKRGNLDLRDVLEQKYIQRWGWTKGVDDLLEYWFSDGQLNEEMMSLVGELRGVGVRCVLATDNEKYRMDYMRERLGLGNRFDVIVASHEVGAMKMEDKMLERVVGMCASEPGKALFCDDREKHAGLIEKYGFIPHIYKSIGEFRKVLRGYGVKVGQD
jgi:putative hydrolase of the HAD superfamily